jgi:hypothetical protein
MPRKKKEIEETDDKEATDEVGDLAEEPSLESRKASLEKELEENLTAQGTLKSEETEIRGELDAILHHLEGDASPHSNQIAIMDYIESQNRQRAERMGVFVEPAVRKSPLDQALAGNRKRGQNRPEFPVAK